MPISENSPNLATQYICVLYSEVFLPWNGYFGAVDDDRWIVSVDELWSIAADQDIL
jgi:hypothetical protein